LTKLFRARSLRIDVETPTVSVIAIKVRERYFVG
jgi:hypothetical protein